MTRALFLHGLGASPATWSHAVDSWAGPALAPRLPWSWTSARAWGRSAERDVDVLADLVEPGDLVVAHSYAATTMLLVAAEYPDRLPAAVVLVAPFHLGRGAAMEWDEARRLFDDFEPILAEGLAVAGGRPVRRDRFAAMARAARDAIGPAGWGRFMTAYAETAWADPSPLVGRVAMIHGTHDRAAPPEGSSRLRADLPGSRVLRLPGAGHFPMADNPAGFADALHLAAGHLLGARRAAPARAA